MPQWSTRYEAAFVANDLDALEEFNRYTVLDKCSHDQHEEHHEEPGKGTGPYHRRDGTPAGIEVSSVYRAFV